MDQNFATINCHVCSLGFFVVSFSKDKNLVVLGIKLEFLSLLLKLKVLLKNISFDFHFRSLFLSQDAILLLSGSDFIV